MWMVGGWGSGMSRRRAVRPVTRAEEGTAGGCRWAGGGGEVRSPRMIPLLPSTLPGGGNASDAVGDG